MNKVGILYICIGRYDIFWKDFYLSIEKYFLKDSEIHYFVFTDAENIFDETNNRRIHRIYQKDLWWPNNTLMRFQMFLDHKREYEDIDYLFFCNADLEVVSLIEENEFLPIGKQKYLATLHPGYYDKKRGSFPYEKNPLSTAYIQDDMWERYFAWWLLWGKTRDFLFASGQCNQNILKDKVHWFVARWHDESYWNQFLAGRDDVHILESSFLYPQRSKLKIQKKIQIRDKRDVSWFWEYYYSQWRKLGLLTKLLSIFWK